MDTKYLGIRIEKSDDGWWLVEDGNGTDRYLFPHLDHYPTEKEIFEFREIYKSYPGY